MKKVSIFAVLLGLLAAVLASGCLEEKVLQVIANGFAEMEFPQDENSATFTTPDTLDYAAELDSILAKNDIDKTDIKSANIVSGSYGVIQCQPPVGHSDWLISGAIQVERIDAGYEEGPVDLILYQSQSVKGAVGATIAAPLEGAGVALLNRALNGYLDTLTVQRPVLVGIVNNGAVSPAPSDNDRMVFDWKARLNFQLLYETEVEALDPYAGVKD